MATAAIPWQNGEAVLTCITGRTLRRVGTDHLCEAVSKQTGPFRFRLGHAFRTAPCATDLDDLAEVLDIIDGATQLEPRPPADPQAVLRAEQLLGIADRVIYTFSGCLHPKLGTIGLVLSSNLIDTSLQGVSRCDSGGLIGRRGAFEVLSSQEAEDALLSLSYRGTGGLRWEDDFITEVNASYSNSRSYVMGTAPAHEHWKDVRSTCIRQAGVDIDRRLWTWEVRLRGLVTGASVEGLVLSPEAFKRLEQLRLAGRTVPDSVRVIAGTVSEAGVHYFEEDAVVDLLIGGTTS